VMIQSFVTYLVTLSVRLLLNDVLPVPELLSVDLPIRNLLSDDLIIQEIIWH
jgi:hypothetical protein